MGTQAVQCRKFGPASILGGVRLSLLAPALLCYITSMPGAPSITPQGLTLKAEKNVITIAGMDKELVGSFAAKVRALKKPEPYKGKGFHYSDEVVRRKQGKKSV